MKLPVLNLFPTAVLVATLASTFAYYKECFDDQSLCITTETETSYWNYRYRHQTWVSAELWCERNSSSLAAVSDEKVQNAISAFIASSSANMGNGNIFIGGKRSTTEKFQWIDGSESGYKSIEESEHLRYIFLNRTSSGDTFVYYGIGTLKLKFICSFYDPNNSRCSEGNLINDRCYIVHNDNVTWFDARIRCLKENADLAIFTQNFNLTRRSLNLKPGEYWIGMVGELWFWSDGSKMNYYNWLDRYPDNKSGDCVCISKSSPKWTNCDCSKEYRFICIQDLPRASPSTEVITQPMNFASEWSLSSTMPHTAEPVTKGNDSPENISNSPFSYPGMVGLGIVVFLLIVAISALIVFVVRTKRKRGGAGGASKSVSEIDGCPKQKQLCLSSDDASVAVYAEIAGSPDTVYAKVLPSERTMSEADKTPTKMIYVQLDMAPKIDESGTEERSSQFLKPPETVYANYIAHDVQ